MATLIAIDPGDIHCGIAFFSRDDERRWRCTGTIELPPDELEQSLAEEFVDQDPDFEFVVYEKFRLYEDKKDEQVGSEFRTSKCIGVIEFLGRTHNEHARQHRMAEQRGLLVSCEQQGGTCAADRPGKPRDPRAVEMIKVPAENHTFAAKILNAKRFRSIAKEEGDKLGHRKVAEEHGWYYILKHLKEQPHPDVLKVK